MSKWIYHFGAGAAEGNMALKNILGGKGACLAEMSSLGLPVPAGFTITTDVCNHYFHQDSNWPEGLQENLDQIWSGVKIHPGPPPHIHINAELGLAGVPWS